MIFEAKLKLATTLGKLTRKVGRGGTSLPGKVLNRLDSHSIEKLSQNLGRGSLVISATNGKTTTAAMVASILSTSGEKLVHNHAGANMLGGIATTLADAAQANGGGKRLGLFEVDEFWLGPAMEQLNPRALLLGNLFRDQLDRFGELETIADRWAAVCEKYGEYCKLVLNADDPLIADLGRDQRNAVFFGVEDEGVVTPQLQHASDSKHCRRCGTAYVYYRVYLAHLGEYTCPGCGATRPTPTILATNIELNGMSSSSFDLVTPCRTVKVNLPLPGLYNIYNALGAAALCSELNVKLEDIVSGLQSVEPAFGRAEVVEVGARKVSLLLIKNPAGANEVFRTLALEDDKLDVLGILNDRIADGRDVSWVWDADWEVLVPHIRHIVCSGSRAAELALRLRYAGLDGERISVVEGVEQALDSVEKNSTPLFILPTYTALLELRTLLSSRGVAKEYWR